MTARVVKGRQSAARRQTDKQSGHAHDTPAALHPQTHPHHAFTRTRHPAFTHGGLHAEDEGRGGERGAKAREPVQQASVTDGSEE